MEFFGLSLVNESDTATSNNATLSSLYDTIDGGSNTHVDLDTLLGSSHEPIGSTNPQGADKDANGGNSGQGSYTFPNEDASLPVENEQFTINLNLIDDTLQPLTSLPSVEPHQDLCQLHYEQSSLGHHESVLQSSGHHDQEHEFFQMDYPSTQLCNEISQNLDDATHVQKDKRKRSAESRSDQDYMSDDNSCSMDSVINDSSLLGLSVKDLNKKLQGLPKSEVAKVKRKRRTLKNRGYAQNCRQKKQVQRKDLEVSLVSLQNRILSLKQELKVITEERDELRRQLNAKRSL